jgi:hypothetical protein
MRLQILLLVLREWRTRWSWWFSTHHARGDPPGMLVASMGPTITARTGFLVAFADLCRDRTCKKPKGQSLFFLVDHGYPEMLPTVGAEKLREMLEGTML